MKNHIIAVIGGTGKSGTYLIRELLANGYALKLLVRNPLRYTGSMEGVELVPGDIRNYHSALEVLKGCAAVISTLGQPRGEASIFSTASRNILRAMEVHGLKRYIVITGLSVHSRGDHKSEKVQRATEWMYTHFPETTLDKQVEQELLAKSTIDWTLVRLPLIIQTDEQFAIRIDLHDCPGDGISATDLSQFLVEQLSDKQYIRQCPFIANR